MLGPPLKTFVDQLGKRKNACNLCPIVIACQETRTWNCSQFIVFGSAFSARMQVDHVFFVTVSMCWSVSCGLWSSRRLFAILRWPCWRLTVSVFLSVRFTACPWRRLAALGVGRHAVRGSCSTRFCAAYSLCFLRCGLRHWSLDTCLLATHRDGVAASLRKAFIFYLIAQSIRFFFSFLFIFLFPPFFSFSLLSLLFPLPILICFRFGDTLML